MKKSNKPEINSEELLKDFDKIMSFISKMENQDLTKINLESLSNKTKKIQKDIEDKYNPIIKKIQKNLDSLK
jgi:hypothetical protein